MGNHAALPTSSTNISIHINSGPGSKDSTMAYRSSGQFDAAVTKASKETATTSTDKPPTDTAVTKASKDTATTSTDKPQTDTAVTKASKDTATASTDKPPADTAATKDTKTTATTSTEKVSAVDTKATTAPEKTNTEKLDASFAKLRQSSSQAYGDSVRWGGTVGSEASADLRTGLTKQWNTANDEQGVYKLKTAFDKTGILAEETIAKSSENFASARKNVTSLQQSGIITDSYATKLNAALNEADSAYKGLQTAIGKGGDVKLMSDSQVDKVVTAMDKAAAEMKDVNELMSIENFSANSDIKANSNWLKDGIGNVGYLTHIKNNAEKTGSSKVSLAAEKFHDAISDFKKGAPNGEALKAAATEFETSIRTEADPVLKKNYAVHFDKYDISGQISNLVDNSATMSSADAAKAFDDIDVSIRSVHGAYAGKHARQARGTESVQQAFDKQAGTTQKLIDQIRDKYQGISDSTTNIGEIDELLKGVEEIASRLASGEKYSSNDDLHAIRALQNLIDYRVENADIKKGDSKATEFISKLTGDNGFQNRRGLDNIPTNTEGAITQLGMDNGGIEYLVKGILGNENSMASALKRLESTPPDNAHQRSHYDSGHLSRRSDSHSRGHDHHSNPFSFRNSIRIGNAYNPMGSDGQNGFGNSITINNMRNPFSFGNSTITINNLSSPSSMNGSGQGNMGMSLAMRNPVGYGNMGNPAMSNPFAMGNPAMSNPFAMGNPAMSNSFAMSNPAMSYRNMGNPSAMGPVSFNNMSNPFSMGNTININNINNTFNVNKPMHISSMSNPFSFGGSQSINIGSQFNLGPQNGRQFG